MGRAAYVGIFYRLDFAGFFVYAVDVQSQTQVDHDPPLPCVDRTADDIGAENSVDVGAGSGRGSHPQAVGICGHVGCDPYFNLT